ncbi:outer membrane beta-barrel protein [candidate division KSB1 bacterium]|nr:outer membrane beta-barrel protein [candidate division KSB1 bacterium]
MPCFRIKYLFVFALFLASFSFAKGRLSRANIGIEYGVWKPSSLDAYPNQPLKSVDGADPIIGISFTSPFLKSHALRISLMQWQQRELMQIGLESVTLRNLSFDLKYVLLPDYKLSPYVSYGIAAIWSREQPSGSKSHEIPLDRAGWGFNLGAGIDFLVGRHLGLGMEYQYSYAVFAKPVGLTDNYSGPKIAAKLVFIF